ncbi:hypothetical protein FACS189479_05520 [Spirochaetia bacterium]|nr:hypothetical protein FACS189479_05520 [Spirochaetia bacterium]
MTSKKAKESTEIVELKRIEVKSLPIKLVGISPLVVHAWGDASIAEILVKQTGATKTKKKFKSPVGDFINSLYWLTEYPKEDTMEAFHAAVKKGAKFGFPVVAFKSSAITGAYGCGAIPNMKIARGHIHIDGDFVEIKGVPVMRQDMVKVGGITKVADIRFRAAFNEWSTSFIVNYTANLFTAEQIVNFFEMGGYSVGVGENRPEKKGGEWGRYKVAVTK